MVQNNTLIQLWVFALIMLVVTSMNRREGMEETKPEVADSMHDSVADDMHDSVADSMHDSVADDMQDSVEASECDGSGGLTRVAYDEGDVKGMGKAVAKVMRTGMYEGVHNAHSEACYALTKFNAQILDEANKFINNMASCGSTENFNNFLQQFESNYDNWLGELDRLSEEYNMDAGPLKKLLKKYKKLLITRLSKGELPDKDYLKQQLDAFTEEFCIGRSTDKTVGVNGEIMRKGARLLGDFGSRGGRMQMGGWVGGGGNKK